MPKRFNVAAARELYCTDRWGGGYFDISKDGNVRVYPSQSDAFIDVIDVVDEAKKRGLQFPVVLRFQDLLRHRVESLNMAFASAIEESGYRSGYRGVFPIKVNQLREVAEEIIDAGRGFHFGLEVGSKPELMAALALHEDGESLIICNGCKDAAFVRHALTGRMLGKKIILVIEKIEELGQVLDLAEEMGVEPMIGVRLRLQSKGAGKWATSGGENAKFGLTTANLVEVSRVLKKRKLANCLRLVHFHVGSQVPDIRTVKAAVREAARFYAKLVQMGHPLGFIDVGGGLGVDYQGSRSTSDSSMNYTMSEYARDVVYNVMDVLDAEKVGHPVIVSESGRAIVAHHSMLVVEAFGSIEKNPERFPVTVGESDRQLVRDMWELRGSASKRKRLENLHDASQIKEQAQSMFDLGLLDLESKAKVETLYWEICEKTVARFEGVTPVPEEVRELETALADQYLCNFSVFQSLLDHWALGQLFPVMPLTRLNTRPDRNATLVDITCDSDGKVSKFVGFDEHKDTIKLHRFKPGEPYYLGIFMVGAYQDIMGDFHNLFGRATEVHLFLDEDEESGYYVEEVIEGTTIQDVLTMTQWDKRYLVRLFKAQVDRAIKEDRLKPNKGMRLLRAYEDGLGSFSYLKFDD